MLAFFIRRPVFTTSVFLLLTFCGFFAYQKLELREYPDLSGNTIMISTSYPGANASTIESMVTTPIETTLQGIDGVDYISSNSKSGVSQVSVNLTINADENKAVTQIQTALSSVSSKLPNGVNDPVIREADASSMPDMVLSFSSNSMQASTVSDYITRNIEPILSNLNGVGELQIMGDRQYAMRIWLNPYKMQKYGISAIDVDNALTKQNVQATPGEIDRKSQIITIEAKTDNNTADEFSNLIIKQVDNTVIRLKDTAKVKLGAEDTTSSMFTNGQPAVGLAITYKNDANPIVSAKLIKSAINSIQLPTGLHVQVMRDSSLYINAALEEIVSTLIITIVLVMLIIALFLGSLRWSLIPLSAIPLSLCGTLLVMYNLGFSINLMTLLAFVLAIGLVVDDAIVVMENIHRHMLMGKSPLQAAMCGIKELTSAVIGITITLLAVFAPIGLNTSITGALFKQFAFTLASAVLISGVVALFFTPMLCSKVITTHEGRFAVKTEKCFTQLSLLYKKLLRCIIHQKKIILMLLILILILGGSCFFLLSEKSELAPSEDQGVLIGMAIGPTSASLNYTQSYTLPLSPIFKKVPEIQNNTITNGFPMGEYASMIILSLTSWDDRNLSASEITQKLMPELSQNKGLNIMLNSPPALPISKGIYNFEYVIKSMGSYSNLSQVANKIVSEAANNPEIINTQIDLHIDQPQVLIKVNKTKANYIGVSMDDIAKVLSVAFGQPENNEFTLNGYGYYVIPQLSDLTRDNQGIIDVLTVPTSSGKQIPLSSVIQLQNEVVSSSWPHFQGQRAVTISAQLAGNYSTQQALSYFQSLFNEYKTDQMSEDTSGQTRSFLQTQDSMALLFLAALLVIFLVLSAQYESFIDPLIIMFSVPLAITSALLALYFFHYSLNIYTEIGLITLIGLITKHGILLIDFARQHQKEHKSSIEASIIEAGSIRLKPVLMTTLAMLFGSIPLILASGAGSNARNQLGMVIFAGMLFGTLFTLIILPTIYCIFKRKPACLER